MVVNEVTLAETIVGAMTYMFCVAFSGGLGLLCAAAIGYNIYKKEGKKMIKTRGKGVV